MPIGLAADLMAVGLPSEQAFRVGTDSIATVTAAGTTQGTAAAITSRASIISTASSQTGAILPSTAELMQVYVGYAPESDTAVLFPHSGGNINGGSTNAGVNVAQGKSYLAMRTSTTVWLVIVSA